MTKQYHQLIKLITKQVKKYWMHQNVSTLVGNITQRTQNKFSNIQNTAIEKYVIKRFNDQTSMIKDLNVKTLQESTLLPKRIVKWWQWYQQLTGLDKVEANKHQVTVLQDRMFECQDKRRSLNNNITDITYKLQEVYGELIQTRRDDPKYVHLTIVENKCLQEQNKLITQRALLEKEERDNFMQLVTAIKEYHDSQSINTQRYKYLSIIASALMAIVSLIGSMIYNNKRLANIRNVEIAQEKNESLIRTNINQVSNLSNMFHAFDTKLSQHLANADRAQANNEQYNSFNTLLTYATYIVHPVTSGAYYIKKGIGACGSYVIKIFYW